MKNKFHFKTFVFFLTLFPFLCFSQGNGVLFFSKNWLPAELKTMHHYRCEFYKNEKNGFEGAFNCFAVSNDKLVKSYFFKNNQLHGEITEYFENGDVKLKAFYNEGLPIGEWKEWDKSGELVVHKTFDENSKLVKDYFIEKNPYDLAIGLSAKKEEPPIYGSKCLLTRIENEKYKCSDEQLLMYYNNPPKPPDYLISKKGKTYITKLKYELSNRGQVTQVKILNSCGDAFLDSLAETHVLNMLPFEAAKQYGTPINYWMEADIVFSF